MAISRLTSSQPAALRTSQSRPDRLTPSWELVEQYLAAGLTVVGIDEVGRGAWAGPVVAAAVVLPPRLQLTGLADSKLVPKPRRLRLDRQIKTTAQALGLGWVAATEIDQYGLSWAVRQSGLRALAAAGLDFAAPHIMVMLDGKHNYLAGDCRAEVIVKGDAKLTPIAAASVVAKVARDRYMAAQERRFQGYGFDRHVGYGTAYHRAALDRQGASPLHRMSWTPLAGYVAD